MAAPHRPLVLSGALRRHRVRSVGRAGEAPDPLASSILPLLALVSAEGFGRGCAGAELSDLLLWELLSCNQLQLQPMTQGQHQLSRQQSASPSAAGVRNLSLASFEIDIFKVSGYF